jgi:ABC-type amino acid transport system permease subunit
MAARFTLTDQIVIHALSGCASANWLHTPALNLAAMSIRTPTRNHQEIPLWRDERVLNAAAQIVSTVVILGLLYWGIANFLEITQQRGMPLTYGFLDDPAGFPITESYIPYDPTMSFGRAFMVGLINTLVVSVVGIILSTPLGLIVALARLSSNWLINKVRWLTLNFIATSRCWCCSSCGISVFLPACRAPKKA